MKWLAERQAQPVCSRVPGGVTSVAVQAATLGSFPPAADAGGTEGAACFAALSTALDAVVGPLTSRGWRSPKAKATIQPTLPSHRAMRGQGDCGPQLATHWGAIFARALSMYRAARTLEFSMKGPCECQLSEISVSLAFLLAGVVNNTSRVEAEAEPDRRARQRQSHHTG